MSDQMKRAPEVLHAGERWIRLVGIVLITVSVLSASCDAVPTSASEACDETIGQEVLERINQQRAASGLEPLRVDTRLVASASGHSADMADHDFVGHTGNNGSKAGERIESAGYEWNYYSENVAAGQTTPEAVVDAWMTSPGHRANIMSPDGEHLGVGYVFRSGTEYGHYWTVNFGRTTGAEASPPGGCHP